jgi:hypothetical protein
MTLGGAVGVASDASSRRCALEHIVKLTSMVDAIDLV